MKNRSLLASAFLALAVVLPFSSALRADDAPVHPAPKGTHGWSWKTPPDLVTATSAYRCNVFTVGDPIAFTLTPSDVALTYEVRNYFGDLVDHGPAADSITIKTQPPGWYKLYIYGKGQVDSTPPVDRSLWADIVGGTNFCVFRKDPNFPALPGKDVVILKNNDDEVMRGVIGMGPQRHVAYAEKPDQSIKDLQIEIDQDKKYYLPYDPLRHRALLVAFPNGTKNLDGVRQIVDHFKDDVEYWEPRNEPNYGSNGTDFVTKEMKPFYDTIKSVSPKLKVLGPGIVGISPNNPNGLTFMEDFFKAGGGNDIDGLSFHAYGAVNGDLMTGRLALDTLTALMKKYNVDKELWQTEQGYVAPVYGSYQPRHQGQWTMIEMMLFEQFHLPKEHNHYWYDVSHGFWDFPCFWENDDTSLNPAAPLMRVYAEEVFGTNFSKAYDFGPVGNQIYLGSLFTGPDKNVAVFQTGGDPDGQIELNVTGGDKLHVTSAFGVEQDIPVVNGKATLKVPELPVWVDMAKGQTIDVVPFDWGPNLAREPGVVGDAMDQPQVAVPTSADPSSDGVKFSPAPSINDGKFENWYYNGAKVWDQLVTQFPTWVRVSFPKPTEISRVVIYTGIPWQRAGTLLDYELQYWDKTAWKTIDHVQDDPKTFGVFTPTVHCSVDSFFDDRSVFQHEFKPVTTDKIRLLIHNTTWGGGALKIVSDAGGQCWGAPMFSIREIEVYDK